MGRKFYRNLKRISVFLTEPQIAALEGIHQATKVPTSVRIREGVNWVIEQHSVKRANTRKTKAKRNFVLVID